MGGMKTPCEIFVWYLLPGIRQELARSMVQVNGLTQSRAAELLGITDAAVSQYLSGKRGNMEFPPGISDEINKSSTAIIRDGGGPAVVRELCRICGLVKETDMMAQLYEKHSGIPNLDCRV